MQSAIHPNELLLGWSLLVFLHNYTALFQLQAERTKTPFGAVLQSRTLVQITFCTL